MGVCTNNPMRDGKGGAMLKKEQGAKEKVRERKDENRAQEQKTGRVRGKI